MRTLLNRSESQYVSKDYRKGSSDGTSTLNKDMLVETPDYDGDNSFEVYKKGFLTPICQATDDDYLNASFSSDEFEGARSCDQEVRKETRKPSETEKYHHDKKDDSSEDPIPEVANLGPEAKPENLTMKEEAKNNGSKADEEGQELNPELTTKQVVMQPEKNKRKSSAKRTKKIVEQPPESKEVGKDKRIQEEQKFFSEKEMVRLLPGVNIPSLEKCRLKKRKYFKRKIQRDKKLKKAMNERVWELMMEKKASKARKRKLLLKVLKTRRQRRMKDKILKSLTKTAPKTDNQVISKVQLLQDLLPFPVHGLRHSELFTNFNRGTRCQDMISNLRICSTYSEQLNNQFTFFEGNFYSTLKEFINWV